MCCGCFLSDADSQIETTDTNREFRTVIFFLFGPKSQRSGGAVLMPRRRTAQRLSHIDAMIAAGGRAQDLMFDTVANLVATPSSMAVKPVGDGGGGGEGGVPRVAQSRRRCGNFDRDDGREFQPKEYQHVFKRCIALSAESTHPRQTGLGSAGRCRGAAYGALSRCGNARVQSAVWFPLPPQSVLKTNSASRLAKCRARSRLTHAYLGGYTSTITRGYRSKMTNLTSASQNTR